MISLTVSNNDIFSLFLKWLFLYIISIRKSMIHITNKVTKVRLHPEIIYKINNETRNTLLHFLVFSDKNIPLRRKPTKWLNNSSAFANELFECDWSFCELVLEGFMQYSLQMFTPFRTYIHLYFIQVFCSQTSSLVLETNTV